MIVDAITSDVSSASAFVTSYTNASLANLTKRFDAGTVSGGGGGISVATGDWASTGSAGTDAVVLTSTINAFMSIGLIPEPHITSFTNTFEGGTNGTTLTNANSGGASGMELISIANNAGTTLTFSNVQARGTLSFCINFAVLAAGYGIWNWVSSIRSVFRFYYYAEEYDTNFFEVIQTRNSSAIMAKIGLTNSVNGTQVFVIQNAAAASVIASPYPLQPNHWYRVEMAVTKGTTTSNGRIEFAYYDKDSSAAIYTADTGTTTNTGTTDFATIRVGSSNGPTSYPVVAYYDDLAVQELASGFIGPSVTATTYDKTQFSPFF
jgi:hypothetical protein